MSIVKEMRERQTVVVSSSSSGLGSILLIGCAAFAIGVLAIAGWKMWPGSKSAVPAFSLGNQPGALPQAAASPAPKFSGKRLGEAAQAPLLAACAKGDNFEGFGNGSPQAVYAMLNMMGTATRIGSMVGAEGANSSQLVDYWRLIAECVYQQNSWNLCEPNNRAIAVESALAFIRGAAAVAADPPRGRGTAAALRNNAQSRERVLDALRARVRGGYLIADDFGAFRPAEIRTILAETKPIGNGCAKQ